MADRALGRDIVAHGAPPGRRTAAVDHGQVSLSNARCAAFTIGACTMMIVGLAPSAPLRARIGGQRQSETFTARLPIAADGAIELRVEVDEERLRFGYRLGAAERDRAEAEPWQWLPQVFDVSLLSDESSAPGVPNFTDAFVGMACHDTSGSARHADFDWFEYQERPYRARW